MWPFTRREDSLYKMLEVQGVKIAILQAEIEQINAKLRKKIYKTVVEEDQSPSTETVKYDDGFDELRKLNHGNNNSAPNPSGFP